MIHLLIYRLVIGLYITGVRIASLFNPKARLFLTGRRGLLTRMRQQLEAERRPRIWVHCASLGEFEQGRPVIEALRAQYPQYAIVLTFFSPSGYEVRKNYDGADHIFYLPIDTGRNAVRFLNIVKPSLCLFIKYELWYGYLKGIADRKIPAMLVSAIFNEQQGFFKWYGGLQRRMLQCFSHILVQDERSRQLLEGIQVSNVSVSGDTRFDRVIKACGQPVSLPQAEAFAGNNKILIAGSTWPEDEQLLHSALPQLPEGWKLVLVPHEVHAAHIADIEKLYCDKLAKWSTWNNNDAAKPVLLIDKVGFLLQLYSYGDVALIGGGFGKAGVHNVLEAAVYGMPCLYGPVYHQFREAVQLVDAGAATVVNTPADLVAAISKYNDEAVRTNTGRQAKDYVYAHGGATARVMEKIAPVLARSAAKDM